MKRSLREVERLTGVNSGYLSQLERDEIASPGPSVLLKLAAAYDEPMSVLMRWAGYVEDGLSPNAQRALSVLGDDFTDRELEVLKAVLDAVRASGGAAYSPHVTDLVLPARDLVTIRSHARGVLRELGRSSGAVDLDEAVRVARLVRSGGIELDTNDRRKLRERFGALADAMINRLQGMMHFGSQEIFVNQDMHVLKQRFVTAHEVGHAVLPDHRAVFAHLDDRQRLAPGFNDRLERQANLFAIELLSQGEQLRDEWDSSTPSASGLLRLAGKYELSIQAAARRVAEDSKHPIAIAIAHKGYNRRPHRLYRSSSFHQRFGWTAEQHPDAQVEATLDAVTAGRESPPLFVQDRARKGTAMRSDGVDTVYATYALFWPAANRWRAMAARRLP